MKIENVQEHKSENVLTIDIGQTIKNAADLMFHRRAAAVVVTQGRTPVGLVTERDVVDALATLGERAGGQPPSEIVTGHFVAVPPEETIKHALSIMTHGRVRHLPVIDGDELVGIVSLDDIVKYRLEEVEMASDVLRDIYATAH